jgi:hypothetical protein
MPGSSRLPGLKLRTRDYELGSPSLYSEGHVRPKERRDIIQSQIERELQRLKEKDSQSDDLIDVRAIYPLFKASLTCLSEPLSKLTRRNKTKILIFRCSRWPCYNSRGLSHV